MDYQPLFLSPESTQDLARPGFLALNPQGPHQIERSLNYMRGLLDSNKLVTIDSAIRRRVLIDVQGNRQDSMLFSYGIAKECRNQGEILAFLSSGSSEEEESGLKSSAFRVSSAYWLFPCSNLYFEKLLSNFDDDLDHESEGMVYLDDQTALSSAQTEMKDRLYIISEYYLSKHSTKRRKQSVLVPQFDRLEFSKARSTINASVNLEPLNVVPLKSPQKTRLRPSQKKKYTRKVGKEREQYSKNYSYSCESLLSIIVDKKRHGKTAILELKKSGPELSHLLTQFSASIAGAGLALLFSVVCKVATGRVPFCASKLLNTGLGFGLVWLSWSVNRLRNMIIQISKNSDKRASKEVEMLKNLDSSVKEIFFRAATLTAMMVLRLA
ncbi:DNA-directed RNA polymerase III subunit RPC8-like [Heracleum sosnowskyi]|uniref:DNA-directed RNA polymerase III subunit RPC8-like n=1 Tax=Heracleum sosnowskyi TaxID=360622 RepID=A0AAD8GX60_9APIA|nr:DNA-directed RNA polymerase III subunit RPC8-like [Heracleum sosnowskyi]